MEEKERYEIKDRWLVDTQNNYKQIYAIDSYIDRPIIDLLNQQDKQIKELEEENGYIIFSDSYDENGIAIHEQKFVKYKDIFKELVDENKKLKQENQQLKEHLEQIENIKAVEFIDAIKHYEQQIRELKKQLEEKEKQIFELMSKLDLKENEPVYCSLSGRDCEVLGKVKDLEKQLKQSQNQKAIEELEKIAEKIKSVPKCFDAHNLIPTFKTYRITDDGVKTDECGNKIIKAGTPLFETKNFEQDRTLAVSTSKTIFGRTDIAGFVRYDIDVSSGEAVVMCRNMDYADQMELLEQYIDNQIKELKGEEDKKNESKTKSNSKQ